MIQRLVTFFSPAVRTKFLVYAFLYVVLIVIILSTFLLEPEENASFPILRIIIIGFASILLTKYFLYMVLSPWNEILTLHRERRRRPAVDDMHYYPKVSILVPAWNEEVGVITTINGLLKSTYKNVEILVIDNASKDNTARNVKALIKQYNAEQPSPVHAHHIELKYFYEGTQGKGHALNHGLRVATGDIIMSIDADCFVAPATVGNFVKYFNDPTVMAAVGNVRIGNTDTIVGVVQYLEFLFSFYFKKAESLVNTIYIIGGAAGAFRREVFDIIGPYSTTNITEDIELSMRIQAAGMRIVYAHDAHVLTEGAVTLNGLMKQRLRWKRGRFETLVEHKYMLFSREKHHNKLLTWFLLPLTLLGELQLGLEITFLVFLYVFSYLTNDFSSFYSGIMVVSSMFIIQVLFDKHREKLGGFILLAPIGWLLFYVSTLVETNALFKALWGSLRKTELTWQKWERQGVLTGKTVAQSLKEVTPLYNLTKYATTTKPLGCGCRHNARTKRRPYPQKPTATTSSTPTD
ncbi:glycosyltransferase family 2 protein [Patescibacteria group bacterium]|nr:glycosyltransferase family 2 protein [Patescibacteria group bacterium]